LRVVLSRKDVGLPTKPAKHVEQSAANTFIH